VFGDETADAAYARFAAALARQTAKGARDVMIVTHGTILTLYLARVAGVDPFPFWKALATPAAIVLESGQIRILDAANR
jgi:broad specificity phosphatase PhoE